MVSKSSYGGFMASRKIKKCSLQSIIYIDDEGIVGESNSRNGGKGGDFASGPISEKKSNPPCSQSNLFEKSDDGEYQQFNLGSSFPFKLSKCTQIHPGNRLSRNHFGLFSDFDSSSSESDGSDYELMEDSSGTVCKQLEEAALRRKVLEDIHVSSGKICDLWEEASLREQVLEDIRNCRCELGNQMSAFGSTIDPVNPSHESAWRDANTENNTNGTNYNTAAQPLDEPIRSSSSNGGSEKENLPTFSVSLTHGGENPTAKLCQTFDQSSHESAGYSNREEAVLEEPLSCGTQSRLNVQLNHERTAFWDYKEQVSGEPSLCGIQPEDERPMWNNLSGNVNGGVPEVWVDLKGDREKHKETDEYKHALKEEWASRQQQLQIQAEEVRQLRKRRKAENMRLLEIERRQRQRVEEMRKTQEKDQETMNLKEQLRSEYRKKLDRLESQFRDTTSLLRGLGIHVGGGLYPMSHDVNLAFKQALLRFHPDRASRSDIHQQVEAEETFKLISRMKEKITLTT